MTQIMLATESAVSRAPQLSSERLVNLFVERQAQDAKSQAPLFGVPGMTAFCTYPTGNARGSWNFNGLAYFVEGPNLHSVDANGNKGILGVGIAGSGPVSMSDNGVQLMIVNGGEGYVYTVAGGLVQVTDPGFYPCSTVIFFDGYFVFDRLGTNEWFLSNLYDGTTYNALDFASAEAQPGFVIATVQNLQLLFIFCTAHIELWYDAGAPTFPFQRYAGGVINYGCISPYAIIKQDGAIFFLGADKVFYRLQANTPIRVSTHPIEHIIQQDLDITQAQCFTFTIEGHKMVVLNLVSSNRTLVFDISTGKWHERQSWTNNPDGSISDLGRWRASTAVEIYQKILLGDAFSGTIGVLDWTVYTEYGNTIPALIQTATQQHDRQRLFVYRFELDVEAGVGLTNGQGSDPQVMLRYSRDGGKTWSLQQQWRSMGKIGQYTRRLRWLKQGVGYQFTWQLAITDPVFRTVIAAHADIEIGE